MKSIKNKNTLHDHIRDLQRDFTGDDDDDNDRGVGGISCVRCFISFSRIELDVQVAICSCKWN